LYQETLVDVDTLPGREGLVAILALAHVGPWLVDADLKWIGPMLQWCLDVYHA